MVVIALIAVAVGVVTLSLRDPAAAQLDREAVRLAALLEIGARRAARQRRAAALRARLTTADDAGFASSACRRGEPLPTRWLDDDVSAEIIGARALMLGPEPLIGAAAHRAAPRANATLDVATDGIGPFVPVP